ILECMGRATCVFMVREQGAHIAITSEAGRGASVRIVLPRVDDLPEERAATDTAIAQPVAQGAETILLVEDEATLRTLAARVLRACGYIVLETIDGVDALQTAQAYAA